MAVANFPYYSTSYGEGFGYNEREGSNTNHFRNRYLNQGYRGSADLGPVRFNATQPTPPLTARPFQATQPLPVAAAAVPTLDFSQAQGAQTARSFSSAAPATTAAAAAAGSLSARAPSAASGYPFVTPASTAPSVAQDFTQSPYYLAPTTTVPRGGYVPNAYSLYNGNYVFQRKEDERYDPHGTYLVEEAKQLQEPAQSIPFGRLHAANAVEIRRSLSFQSDKQGRTNAGGSTNANFNLPPISDDILERSKHPCKWSISRRLAENEALRYHIPGYMGHVKTVQFRHGDTFGRATRKAVRGYNEGI